MLISIIIPCFNEEKVLESTYQRISTALGNLPSASHVHCDREPQTENPKGIPTQSPGLPSVGQSGSDRGYPGIQASEINNPNGVAPNASPSVHGEPQRSRNAHCDHEPPWSSPSPPTEERAGERRPLLRCAQPVHGKVQGMDFELLFVDDGSIDSTPRILKGMAEKDRRVTVIRLSRNFGHQPAVSAGMQHCRGDLAVIIDADLQDPPEVIPEMIEQLRSQKANVVYGVRKSRKGETWFKLATAKMFYALLNKLSEVPMPQNTGDFRVLDRKVIDAFNALPENTKYIRGLISWLGFKQIPFYYERQARFAGSTKYSLTRMIRFASTGIFYFSKKPLQIATAVGFLSVGVGLLLSAWLLFNKFVNPQYLVSGWTSIVLVVIYFGGVQLLTIGILGQYIGNLFDEVKRRPEYIVDEIIKQGRERAAKTSELYFPLAEASLPVSAKNAVPEKQTCVTSDSGG
jgi:glycosyltransferase involved in cell wall biosynthesis